MSTHHDPFLKRVHIPDSRHGRQVNRRDKLMGIAFVLVLLFAFWWITMRPTSYAVAREDLSGVLYYTSSNSTAIYHEFSGHYGQGDVVVIVGIGNNFAETSQRAEVVLVEMLLANEYPSAEMKRFANAVVICGIPDDCSSLAKNVEKNALERESIWRAESYRK